LISQRVPFSTPAFRRIPTAVSPVPKVRQVVAAAPTQTARTGLSAVLTALPLRLPSKLVNQTFLSTWLLPVGLVMSLVIILVLTTRLICLKKGLTTDKAMSDTIIPSDYKILGELAAEHGRLQLAERCYRKVAELDPYDKNIHYKIGEFLVQTKRYAEAIKEFHIALGSEIILPEIYAYLSYAYLETKQLEKAEKYYHKVLELTPNIPKIYTSHDHTFNVFEVFKHLKFDH
jgi:tetratricopeptide (TPR) repeat protein